MKIDISHARNPLLGWDIQAKVSGGKGERVAVVKISVNGFGELEKQIDPPVDQWQTVLSQKGQYPGDNEVRVTVSDENAKETSAIDTWSGN